MILIACVDDHMGMQFNHRRQSQDRILREHILNKFNGTKIWMNQYSAKQFGEHENINIDDDYFSKAAPKDICFVEDRSVAPYAHLISKIILYKWNRIYPSDLFFDIPLSREWHLIATEDFSGSSHDKITEEIYTK